MSCLIWNARGFGNQRAIRELRRLLAERNPSLVFLSETKLQVAQTRVLASRFQFLGSFAVNSNSRSGGLWLLWCNSIEVSIQSYSSGHIDCIVNDNGRKWGFTGFYGNPVRAHRFYSWQLLRRLAGIDELKNLRWLVGGDFNEILFESEKIGGNLRPIIQMKDFVDTMVDCDLHDLTFTWCNKRQGDALIFARLDRFMCNSKWRTQFPFMEIETLEYFGPDHRPIHLVLHLESHINLKLGPKRFTFEHKWMLEDDFTDFFKKSWTDTSGNSNHQNKMAKCKRDLTSCAGKRFNHLGSKITYLPKELNGLMGYEAAKDNYRRIQDLEKQIEKLLNKRKYIGSSDLELIG